MKNARRAAAAGHKTTQRRRRPPVRRRTALPQGRSLTLWNIGRHEFGLFFLVLLATFRRKNLATIVHADIHLVRHAYRPLKQAKAIRTNRLFSVNRAFAKV